MKRIHLPIALVLFSFMASDQLSAFQQVRRDSVSAVDTLQGFVDNYLEDLLEQGTQDAESSELLEKLQDLQEDRLNLNGASIGDLQFIPGVTPIVARNIVVARERAGGFREINDLLAVDGVDARLLAVIKRFAQVPPPTRTQLQMSIRNRIGRDLEDRRGFRDGSFIGSPWRTYSRLQGRYEYATAGTTIDFGVLTAKDAGEAKINDFTSGFVSLSMNSPLKKLIVGDYSVEAGQGLAVWPSVAYSKGLEVIQPAKKSRHGIAPKISSSESGFYRGVVGVLEVSPFEATAFYSNKKVDATLDSLGRVTSIYATGYHRTESELRKRSATSEKTMGARVQYSLGKTFSLGSTYLTTRFDNACLGERLYEFTGNESHVVGLDFDLLLDRVNVFGEIARSHTGTIAGVTGAFIGLAEGADLIICVRDYPRDFISLHGFGFGERNGPPQDEVGIYTGLRLHLMRGFILSSYYDQFKFPWQTATVPFPIDGTDFLLRAELRAFDRCDAELKYKSELKGDAITAEDEFGRSNPRLVGRRQQNGRITATFDVSRDLRVQGRVELVKVGYTKFGKSGSGVLLYQDLRCSPAPRFTVSARLTFFDTDSYDARIYEFESEVRGSVSNPALYGKGRRWYLTVAYSLFDDVDLSAKCSQTYRDDLKVIGSGPDQIDGNVESRLTAQIDIRF
jgi:DNA uptake protein ComE-like DNA-binding protein